MTSPREELRSGLDSVDAITALLQRIERDQHGAGLYQAAEVQFWWSAPQSTDTMNQLFWFDDDEPVAAFLAYDFGGGESLVYEDTTVVVTVLPDAAPEWVAHVVDRGLQQMTEVGIGRIELEIGRDDEVMRSVMSERGFEVGDPAVVECWLDTAQRPAVSPLADGYELRSRADRLDRPHHMAGPRKPRIAERLSELSLYRPELDLVVCDSDGEPAAYGLCWFDPATSTGVVEPMRTHDEHQGRGLARHILTAGIERLAAAGAKHVSIGFEPDNPTSGHLYQSVGFAAHRTTDLFGGSVASLG